MACEVLAAGDRLGADPARSGARSRRGHLALVARGAGDRVLGSLELIRVAEPFDDGELALAELAPRSSRSQSACSAPRRARISQAAARKWLELAGDALAAGGDARPGAAADGAGSPSRRPAPRAASLWRDGGRRAQVELLASLGRRESGLDAAAGARARVRSSTWRPVAIEDIRVFPGARPTPRRSRSASPPFGVLQLYFIEDTMPPRGRAAGARRLRGPRGACPARRGAGERRSRSELERTRALLEVVGEAIARLSLAHTLETAVERISELLGVEHVGVYLREDGQLFAAAGRGLSAGHEEVAARLLEVALGPLRARAADLRATSADDEPALAGPRAALAAAGQRSALAVPLHVRDDSIGLLVAYPGARALGESDICAAHVARRAARGRRAERAPARAVEGAR